MSKSRRREKTEEVNEDPLTGAAGAHPVGVAPGVTGGADAAEDAYWREHYQDRPYVQEGRDYEYYQPAYRFGWESYSQYGERRFDEIDEGLAREWDQRRGASLQTWREARDAARDAWNRASQPGQGVSVTPPYAGRRHP